MRHLPPGTPGRSESGVAATHAAAIKCVVEIPKGSRNKYEYDPLVGGIKLDRFLSSSVVYPTDYGFIPDTLSLDGDALDAMICVSEPTFPGCIVLTRPIGLFEMEDERGIDPHVLCVPCNDPGWNRLQRLDDLPDQLRKEIWHFFAIYKDLDPDRHSNVKGWRDRDAALREIEAISRSRLGHWPALTPDSPRVPPSGPISTGPVWPSG